MAPGCAAGQPSPFAAAGPQTTPFAAEERARTGLDAGRSQRLPTPSPSTQLNNMPRQVKPGLREPAFC